MSIIKEIKVTRKGLPMLLNVTYGTDLIEIGFKITDFVIPAQATAIAYNQGKSAEVHKQTCSIKDNTISFTPEKGFFEEGHNELQFRVTHNNRSLFSFKSKVECQCSFVDDDANEIKNNPTLVEQLLTEQGIMKTRLDEALKIPENGTTADAALNDIKVGEDGTVYASPGEAVRQQVKQLKELDKKNTDQLLNEINKLRSPFSLLKNEDNSLTLVYEEITEE